MKQSIEHVLNHGKCNLGSILDQNSDYAQVTGKLKEKETKGMHVIQA